MYAIEKCEIGPKGFSFQNFGNLILKKKWSKLSILILAIWDRVWITMDILKIILSIIWAIWHWMQYNTLSKSSLSEYVYRPNVDKTNFVTLFFLILI